ncbi:MAG: hypothetical protein ABII02_03795 [Candidatus Magasanikbacteria bacterium]
MLNKVLKKLKESEMKNQIRSSTSSTYADYAHTLNTKSSGFHAKKTSQLGAERQRSIGNRQGKPTKKTT